MQKQNRIFKFLEEQKFQASSLPATTKMSHEFAI